MCAIKWIITTTTPIFTKHRNTLQHYTEIPFTNVHHNWLRRVKYGLKSTCSLKWIMAVTQPVFTQLVLSRCFLKHTYTEFRGNPAHRLAEGCKYPECQVAMATKFCVFEPASGDTSGSCNFEVAPRFLSNLCNPWLGADSRSQTDERM
jgi:hypothetical protein